MNIDEAIETNLHIASVKALNNRLDEEQAVKLGIEALKWVKRYRPDNKTDRWRLLPGETE